MRVISRKKLRQFWKKRPDAEKPLQSWYQAVKSAEWMSFAEVRLAFSHADQVGRCRVFNIGGNKYRLISAIHYNRGIVYVRNVLTHTQYDVGAWKENCQ